jgi:hypothetical protein
MATTKVKMMVQRYPLGATHCAGRYKTDQCTLCEGPPETITHFTVDCPSLKRTRDPYLKKINNILEEFYFYPRSAEELTEVILDCSTLIWVPQHVLEDLEELTIKLIFQLHNERSILLGLGSRYVAAIQSIRSGKVK